jgi:hypothetical protein
LVELSGHIDEAHGFHLFSNCLLTIRAWCTKIEVQIANQEWVRTRGARLPGSFDISQRFQVRGGNITPDDKKLGVVHP